MKVYYSKLREAGCMACYNWILVSRTDVKRIGKLGQLYSDSERRNGFLLALQIGKDHHLCHPSI